MLAVLLTLAVVSLIQGVSAVNKCCPDNQELVGYGKCAEIDPKSINGTNWWFPEHDKMPFPNKSPKKARNGYMPCKPYQWHWITPENTNFTIKDNGDLVYDEERSSTTNWTFPEESYCVDRLTIHTDNLTEFTHIFYLCATRMIQTKMICCPPGEYTKPDGNCGTIPSDAPFSSPMEISIDYFTYVSGPGCRDQDRSFLVDLNESHHRFTPYNLEIFSIKYKSHSYCLSRNPYTGHILAHFCTTVSEKFDFYPYFIFTGVFFFALTLIFHAILPELRSTNHAKYLICHIICLLIGFICIGIGQVAAEKHSLCYIQAFAIQYSFLAGYFWLNAICMDISWTFSGLRPNVHRNRGKFLRYSIYGWGFPAVITIITAIMQFLPSLKNNLFFPGFGISSCFFPDNSPAIWLFFYGPNSLLMSINTLLFIFTTCHIDFIRRDTQGVLHNQQSASHNKPTNKEQQTLSLYFKLFFLMNVSWMTEMLSSLFGGPRYYYYFTDILNLLRSVFIFIFFCCKRRVFVLLANRYGDKIKILKRFFPNERKCQNSRITSQKKTTVTLK